jgi:hypothetical protein
MIEFAGMGSVEIGRAVNAEDDGFAIEDELLMSLLQHGLDDPRITLRPIVAAAGDLVARARHRARREGDSRQLHLVNPRGPVRVP